MKITILLSLILLFVACGPGSTVTIEVCAISGLLPGLWCLSKILKKFKKGQEPKTPCTVCYEPPILIRVCDDTGKRAVANCPAHEVPESEAPDFYCRRHAHTKQTGTTLVLADLGVQCKIQRYSDDELDTYARRIGEAGVDHVRTYFPSGDDGLPSVFPYEREADGRWNLDRPNPAYDANLLRLAIALGRYEVGIYMDMADQCGEGVWTSCWKHNVNGIWGWHDESDKALTYWKGAVDRVLTDIGGPEGNIIGFGNELKHPADADVDVNYILKWGGRRLDYLMSRGLAKPIPFSGSGRFAHKMMGYLSAEDGYYPSYNFVSLVEHGVGLVEHIPPGTASLDDWLRNGHSGLRRYGYSDDGADCDPSWNKIPVAKRGTGNKAGNNYSANTAEKIRVVALFKRVFGNRLVIVEFLPRERSDAQPLSALQQVSLDAFWRVGLEVFGVDIRRTF